MSAATESIQPKKIDLWIGGESVSASSGKYFDSLNPLDDSLYVRAAEGTKEDIDRAVRAAHSAFVDYRHSVVKEREAWLSRAAALLEEQADEFADILIDEIGSSIGKARFEIGAAVSILRAAAGSTRTVAGKTMPSDTPGRFSMSVRAPVGVVAAITPFNVPLSKGVRLTASPLALGNTVVLMPSELAPALALRLAKLYADAGIPAGAFNVVTGFGHDIGDSLTTHPLVKVVTFTGSSVVGKHIQALCGQHGKKLTLELGGKSPLVVLKDADLSKAVPGAVQSIFAYQGQICMGASRIFVEREMLDEFTEKFAGAAGSIGRGELRDPSTVIGPIISDRQRKRIQGHIQDAVDKGATVVTGGEWEGNRCQPTVLTGVTSDMDVYAEETFGPVTSIYPIDSVEEAIEKSNESEYGLSAAIYTANLDAAMKFANEVESGMVHINAPTMYAEPHVPFGGVGDSGFGREGTEVDIDLMTEWKWITLQQ